MLLNIRQIYLLNALRILTYRSAGAEECKLCVCYKHTAPLERKIEYTDYNGIDFQSTQEVLRILTYRSAGAEECKLCVCYKHIAPLERRLNTPIIAELIDFQSTQRAQNSHIPLCWSGRMDLCVFYKHFAPLERKIEYTDYNGID